MIVILGCGGRMFGRVAHDAHLLSSQAYAIVWERANKERQFLKLALHTLATSIREPVKFVAGKAKGADTGVELFARANGYGFDAFRADWNKHGHAAGPIRNKLMYDSSLPDYVVGFCGGAGTSHMINYAVRQGCRNVMQYSDGDIDNFIATGELSR